MITEYHRPETLDEALELLRQPGNVPMGGGTILSRYRKSDVGVIDLQRLGLNKIEQVGNRLMLGAAAVLQDLVDSAVTPEVIKKAASLEAGANIRNAASVGGTLASGDGKSPLLTVLLAMDATLVFAPGNQEMSLGEWLPMRANRDMSQIIVQVIVSTQPEANYMQVGRTPKDIALISAAVAQWPSGRTRVAIGGHLETPIIAMDGPEIGGAVEAAQNAYSQHGGVWASQEYLVSTIATLVSRMTAPDGR